MSPTDVASMTGCIDMGNPDNAGLQGVIDTLSSVVDRHAKDGVSRADIWALAGVAGPAVLQGNNDRIDFPFRSYGRVDCEKTGATCKDANGGTVACAPNKGSHRNLPGINFNTHDVFDFFANEFGYSQRETVVVMGGTPRCSASRKS
jgi:Peroxidase